MFSDLTWFLLFCTITFGAASIGLGMFSNVVSKKEEGGKRVFLVYGVAITIAIFMASSSVIDKQVEDPTLKLVFFIILMALYASIFIVAVKLPYYFKKDTIDTIPSVGHGHGHHDDDESINVHSENDKTVLQSLATADYYFLFVTYLIQVGGGVAILNNMAAIVISKSDIEPDTSISLKDLPYGSSISTFIVLFSVFNTFGRLILGFVSDLLIDKVDRLTWMLLCTFTMCLAQAYFAICSIPMIYVGVIVLGLAYGGTFCLIPTLISDLFGLKHFGANYGLLGVAPALGSTLINAVLAGGLNQLFGDSSSVCILNDYGNCTYYCIGPDCYQFTFFITSALCLIALALSCLLRSKRKYDKTVAEKNSLL